MRLLTRHIHRAFPELDPYADEVCWKFIDAARGGWVMQALLAAGALAAWIVLQMVGLGCWAFVLGGLGVFEADHLGGGWWRWPSALLAGFVLIGVGPVSAYLARDRLLGLRLRYVLRRRGRCPSCRYTLVGLGLSARSTVVCPECGAECEVDPSLGELSREGAATGRVMGGGEFRGPPLLAPSARRWIRRIGIALAVVVFVILPAAAGAWEIAIRRDAARAKTDTTRLQADMLNLFRRSGMQPSGSAGGRRTTREAAAEAMASAERAEAELRAQRKDAGISASCLEAIYDAARWRSGNSSSPEEDAEHLAAARELMQRYREAGLEARLTELADSWPELPPGLEGLTGEGMFLSGSGFFESPLDRFLEARAFELGQTHDVPGLLALIETRLGIARVLCASPLWVDKASGLRSEFDAHAMIVSLLAARPGADVAGEIEAILARRAFDSRIGDMQEWSRITSELAVAGWFSRVDEARLAGWSSLGESIRRVSWTWPRMGWYEENRVQAAALAAVPEGDWGRDAWARTWRAPTRAGAPAVAAWWVDDPARNFGHADRERVERRGISLLLAIERVRALKGAFPDSLAEAADGLPPGATVDPWSGRPFVYRRLSPSEKRPEEGFLLYSVGPDGVDDGGTPPAQKPHHELWVLPDQPGTDVIINQPR